MKMVKVNLMNKVSQGARNISKNLKILVKRLLKMKPLIMTKMISVMKITSSRK